MKLSNQAKKSFALVLVVMMVSAFFVLITSFIAFSTSKIKVLNTRNASYKVDLLRDSVVEVVMQEMMRSLQKRDTGSFASASSSGSEIQWSLPKDRSAYYPATVQALNEANTLICSSGRSDGRFSMERLENKKSGLQGRSVVIEDAKYWEAPCLGKVQDNQLPRWLYFQEDGKLVSDLSEVSSQEPPSVRFGFAMYDIGGLLDIQVAGRTSGQREMRRSGNPTVAYADLTQLPGFTQMMQDELNGFRNSKSNKDLLSASDLQRHFEQHYQTNGLIGNPMKENGFISRQDLIRFYKKKGWPTDSLKYLTTFSRSVERPMFRSDSTWKSSATNKKWIDLRVQSEFDRLNGKKARRGEPLINSYFPLSWLSKLEDESVSSSWIERAFGLKRNGDYWVYTGGTGSQVSTISTIDQVQAQGREPNFFELLKLGIEEGSLGVSAGYTASRTRGIDANKDFQILRIGGNLIDQFDSNHEPTVIQFAQEEFYGLEDLPYLNKFATRPEHVMPTTVGPFYNYVIPELWNNNRKQINPTSTKPYPSIRVRAKEDSWYVPGFYTTLANKYVPYNALRASFSTAPITIQNNGLEYYREPRVIRNASGLELSGQTPPVLPSDMAGVSGYKFDHGTVPVLTVTSANYAGLIGAFSNAVFYAEYQNSKGNWTPYHTFAGLVNDDANMMSRTNGIHPVHAGFGLNSAICGTIRLQGSGVAYTVNPLAFNHGVVKSDPRTTRFGVSISSHGATGNTFFGDRSMRPDMTINLNIAGYYDRNLGYGANAGLQPWSYGDTGNYYGTTGGTVGGYIACMAENRYTRSGPYPHAYPDLDGVRRWGDYGLDVNPFITTPKLNPYRSDDQTYRPIILDRPFKSVGELGYSYRDMPWKSLDLFTTNSADLTLLDLFDAYEHPAVVAGKLSWNVPYPEIWKSLLTGADRAYQATNPQTISDVDAAKIASKIFQSSIGNNSVPVSRSDMVRAIANTEVSEAWPAFKHHREAVVRQIAEVGQSSTVNLMLDLVVEDGKTQIKPQKSPEFIAQGRKRYWVAVAMDRLTYQIVDMQIEEVF